MDKNCDFCGKENKKESMIPDEAEFYWFCKSCWKDVSELDNLILNDI